MNNDFLWLTPFEEYLLEEDRPDYPCCIIVKFHFSGKFEHSTLQNAMDQTLDRNPLLRSVVKRQGRRLYWQVVPDWKLQIEWMSGPLPGVWPNWPTLDLFREPAFRFSIIEMEAGVEMIFHVHHAICDGKALRDVFYDLINFYTIEKGYSVSIPVLKHENLSNRNRLGGTWNERLKTWPTQILGLWMMIMYQKRKIIPLAINQQASVEPLSQSHYTALVSHRIPEEQFRRVRDEAMKHKVTTNEFFIRDLFFSLGKWRAWKMEDAEEQWVRMLIAVDMRKPVDRFLSAANVTSVIALDRRINTLSNRKKLLKLAHYEMSWVKHRGIRFTLWTFLRFCRLLPDGIRRYSNRSGCHGTIIFANHGQLSTRSPLRNKQQKIEVPGAILEHITMVSPLRPGVTAAFVIGSYAGELLIHLHYDPRYHTELDANRLLQIFVDQLNRYEGKK
jgi:NRPS condensation-like uncharacterized protein